MFTSPKTKDMCCILDNFKTKGCNSWENFVFNCVFNFKMRCWLLSFICMCFLKKEAHIWCCSSAIWLPEVVITLFHTFFYFFIVILEWVKLRYMTFFSFGKSRIHIRGFNNQNIPTCPVASEMVCAIALQIGHFECPVCNAFWKAIQLN